MGTSNLCRRSAGDACGGSPTWRKEGVPSIHVFYNLDLAYGRRYPLTNPARMTVAMGFGLPARGEELHWPSNILAQQLLPPTAT